jgi:cytochrome c biogenesis protein CcdA
VAVYDDSDSGRGFSGCRLEDALGALEASGVDFRLLVYRGELSALAEGLSTAAGGESGKPDLVVMTGSEAPGAVIAAGASIGILEVGGTRIPWVSVAPRGNGILRLDFLEGEDPGIEAFELVRGESPESRDILDLGDAFMADLVSAALDKAGEGGERSSMPSDAVIEAIYWYPFGCRDCEDFLWEGIPEIEGVSGTIIEVEERDTGDPNDFEALLSALDERDTDLGLIPVLVVGENVFQGNTEIEEGLWSLASGYGVEREEVLGTPGLEGGGGSVSRWEPGAVFLAGLLDGVNPCAFSAMVFLVSALALAGRTKRSMMVTGISYAAGVFVTYSLIGAGLLGGLRSLAVSSRVGRILELVLVAFLAVLAVLSAVDGFKLSSGRTDLLLKLPKGLSEKAHLIIRNGARSGAAGGGAFLLGAAIALVELGCTGQIYLPTIAWMIARGEGARPWIWLIVYNTAFIIPLVAVFVVSYKGVSAVRMAEAFKRNGSIVKYATAALFAVLAVVILTT